MKYVTRTGRAVSPGRITRSSYSVKQRHRHQQRPLPLELQCHPKILDRTSRNPGCMTSASHLGQGAVLGHFWLREEFINGKNLSKESGRYLLYNKSDGSLIGRTDDVKLALAYKIGAAQHAVYCDVIEGE